MLAAAELPPMGDSLFDDVIPKFPLLKRLGTGVIHGKCRADLKLLDRSDQKLLARKVNLLRTHGEEYRPRRERATDHVARIRCRAAGGRASLEPGGMASDSVTQKVDSPRGYAEYLHPTDEEGQTKIDIVNLEMELFKDANMASINLISENCVDKLKCVDKSKAEQLRRLGIIPRPPRHKESPQSEQRSLSDLPRRSSPVPRVSGLDEMVDEAFPETGSGIFCDLATPHGRRSTLPPFSQTLKRKPVSLNTLDVQSQNHKPGGQESLKPPILPNRGLLQPVSKAVAQFHPCPTITAFSSGSMAMRYAPLRDEVPSRELLQRPSTRGSQGSGLSEMEGLGNTMAEDFWSPEDVQISSAATTQYLPIVVGMSRSDGGHLADPEMPHPIVWH